MRGSLSTEYGCEHEYAGFWVRTGASIIDTILFTIIVTPIMYMIYGDNFFESEKLVLGIPHFIGSYIFPIVATFLFWIYKAATPGKMAVKATVVDAKTGNNLTVKQSLIRYIGYAVAAIPLGIGIFWVALDSKKQGWHDKMAGTVVIRSRTVETVQFKN